MLCFYIWIFVHLVVESLPLSSSGHVFLIEQWCGAVGFSYCGINSALMLDALHAINALLLAFFFFPRWFFFIKIMSTYYKKGYSNYTRYISWMSHIKLLIISILIVDAITVLFYGILKYCFISTIPLYVGFFITGIVLLSASTRSSNIHRNINILLAKHHSFGRMVIGALILGCMQSVALLPGISRLGITYTTCLFLGLSAKHSFEIAYMIEWPLIAGASLLAIYKMYLSHSLGNVINVSILCTILGGAVVSWYALQLTWYLMKKNKLWIFSIYLFTIALIVYLWSNG